MQNRSIRYASSSTKRESLYNISHKSDMCGIETMTDYAYYYGIKSRAVPSCTDSLYEISRYNNAYMFKRYPHKVCIHDCGYGMISSIYSLHDLHTNKTESGGV